jgi:hypothetical protein
MLTTQTKGPATMTTLKITIARQDKDQCNASRCIELCVGGITGNDLPGQEAGSLRNGQFINLTILQKAKIANRINACLPVLDDMTDQFTFNFATAHYGVLVVTVEG